MRGFMPSRRMLALLPILALVVWAGTGVAYAQGTASVSGVINDAGGLPLPGASVTALHIGSGRTFDVVTDEVGKYTFENLIAGEYRITARVEGFSASGKTVRLDARRGLELILTLALGGLTEEITVTAAKGERATAEIPQIVTIVGEEKIERRRPRRHPRGHRAHAGRDDSVETNPLRARPQLRGLESSRVAIMIDGERLNNSRFDVGATGISPNMVDVNHLDAVEVVAGAGSSLYGSDAVAGTINLITKAPRRPDSGVKPRPAWRLRLHHDQTTSSRAGSRRTWLRRAGRPRRRTRAST